LKLILNWNRPKGKATSHSITIYGQCQTEVQRILFWDNFHSPPAKHQQQVRSLVNEMADVITILVLPTVTIGAMIVSLSMNDLLSS
jgi:hypothetical protein